MMHDRRPQTGQCSLCERNVPTHLITQHHLTPKVKGGKAEHRTLMCRPCHKQVHALFSNSELAREFATLDALKLSPRLESFLKWIRKQKPDRNFKTATSRVHPRFGQKRISWMKLTNWRSFPRITLRQRLGTPS